MMLDLNPNIKHFLGETFSPTTESFIFMPSRGHSRIRLENTELQTAGYFGFLQRSQEYPKDPVMKPRLGCRHDVPTQPAKCAVSPVLGWQPKGELRKGCCTTCAVPSFQVEHLPSLHIMISLVSNHPGKSFCHVADLVYPVPRCCSEVHTLLCLLLLDISNATISLWERTMCSCRLPELLLKDTVAAASQIFANQGDIHKRHPCKRLRLLSVV